MPGGSRKLGWKYYALIATVLNKELRNNLVKEDKAVIIEVTRSLATSFKEDNPDFNVERFYEIVRHPTEPEFDLTYRLRKKRDAHPD